MKLGFLKFAKKILFRSGQKIDQDRGILVFENTTDVIRAEDILKNRGWQVRVMGPPPEIRSGCDLVIDEMDYGAWKESIFLQRAARNRGIYYLFSGAIGFGALLTNFDPQGITLEEYNKLPPNEDLSNIKEISVPAERILPVVPSYASTAMSMNMLQEIIAGQIPVPTCSIGVGLASILAASEAINIILRRKEIVKAPQYIYVDLLDHGFVIRAMS